MEDDLIFLENGRRLKKNAKKKQFKAPRLQTQDSALLRDHLLWCVERDMRKALMAKLGADRMAQTSSTQLLVEI